jgi:hypothetical protein
MKYRTGTGQILHLTLREYVARVWGRYRLARSAGSSHRDAIRFALPARR